MKHLATTLLALAPLLATAQGPQLRDPFARPALPPRAVADETQMQTPPLLPQLRALMVTPGRALANINGQILAVGEWFGDYQLIKVEERGVTLSKRGVRSVLVLDEASRK